MKKRLIGTVALACLIAFSALAQSPQKLPITGPQLVPGSTINQIIDQLSGTNTGNYKGTFNGTLGATTPSTAVVTTLNASGASALATTTVSGLLRTTFGTPTIASGACGATTNGVITSGTNQAGLVTIGAATTTVCTILFSATLAAAPNACVLFPASTGAADAGTTRAYVSSITTAQFVITGAALASTAYYWHCI